MTNEGIKAYGNMHEILQEFSRSIEDYITSTKSDLQTMNMNVKSLGGSWRDEHYQLFVEAIEPSLKEIEIQVNKLEAIKSDLDNRADRFRVALEKFKNKI